MSIKLYITAIQSDPDGTAVEIFENYELRYHTRFDLDCDESINEKIGTKIDEVEKERMEQSKPI